MREEKITPDLYLEFCSSSDVVEFEKRHYVEKMPAVGPIEKDGTPRLTAASKKEGMPRGHHGQQIHFLIWYRSKNVGAISGGSAVYAVRSRDEFFGVTKNNREQVINGIIDNTLFRLEEPERNLASRVVALWRKTVIGYWEYLYGVKPFGFETFVQAGDVGDGRQRTGALYRADNWVFVGETYGSTKNHIGVGLTGSEKLGGKGSFARDRVQPKLVFCKWISGFTEPQYCEYKSSWKASTKAGTPEEKKLAKERTERRKLCMGTHNVSEVLKYERQTTSVHQQ